MEPELNLGLYGSVYTEGSQLLDCDKHKGLTVCSRLPEGHT